MAALIFRTHLHRAGLDSCVRVSSAGVDGWHVGKPADARVISLLEAAGYPSDHTAAQVGDEHYGADLLIAMDTSHYDRLVGAKVDPARIRLFRSFDSANGGSLDVPDPYFGGMDDFVAIFALIEAGVPGLMAWLRERLP
jgi:protein-tyrosine phosphatase